MVMTGAAAAAAAAAVGRRFFAGGRRPRAIRHVAQRRQLLVVHLVTVESTEW